MSAAPGPPGHQVRAGFLRDERVRGVARRYESMDLFLFSAATWNPHRIHFDLRYAREAEGYPDLVVQGPLQAAHMFQVLRSCLAEGVRISRVAYRHHSLLYAGEDVEIGGEFGGGDGDRADEASVHMWLARAASGERTTTGRAVLRRSAPPADGG